LRSCACSSTSLRQRSRILRSSALRESCDMCV
jgi:hypothetical protein